MFLPISSQLVQRSYGPRVNVSPVVTVEPRRRKFHKPITLTIPLPHKIFVFNKKKFSSTSTWKCLYK